MHLFNKRDSDLTELQEILGYQFTDIDLLKHALTRQSAVEERRQARERGSFQRLEFIGDKILNLIVAQILYDSYPTWSEGQLTKETERFVNNKTLTNMARKWQLGKHLIVGRGEEINHIRENPKAIADAAEAVLGAIFQDSNNNLQVIKNFISQHWSVIGLKVQLYSLPISDTPILDSYQDIIFCEDKSEKINKIICLMKKGINKDDLQNIFDNYLSEISILKVLCQFKLDQELLDNGLIESVRRCLPEQVELLLSCGANSNYIQKTRDEYDYGATSSISDPYTISVLHCAVESCYSEESIQIIKALLSANANPNWQDAVYWSSRNHKRRTNDELFGIKPHIEEMREKKTALHIIVNGDSPFKEALIALLIQYKANPNLADSDGNTPLHHAANDYHMGLKKNIYHLLIRLGADPQQENIEHETPEQFCQKALSRWDESVKKWKEYSYTSMLLFGNRSKPAASMGTTEAKNTTVPVASQKQTSSDKLLAND